MPYFFLGIAFLIILFMVLYFLSSVETEFIIYVVKLFLSFVCFFICFLSILMGRWIVFVSVTILYILLFVDLKNIFLNKPKIYKPKINYENSLSVKEACEILNLHYRMINNNNVNRSYNKLIKENHPDVGGSVYFTCKLNEARAILLDYIDKNNHN